MRYDDLAKATDGLNPHQLEKLRGRINVLLSLHTTGAPDHEVEVWEALGATLKHRVGIQPLPFPFFKSSPRYPSFRKAVPVVWDYVEAEFQPKNKTERARLLRIVLSVLVDHLKEVEAPPTTWTVTNLMPNVAAFVDQAFPGYRHSGMLRVVLSKKPSSHVPPTREHL